MLVWLGRWRELLLTAAAGVLLGVVVYGILRSGLAIDGGDLVALAGVGLTWVTLRTERTAEYRHKLYDERLQAARDLALAINLVNKAANDHLAYTGEVTLEEADAQRAKKALRTALYRLLEEVQRVRYLLPRSTERGLATYGKLVNGMSAELPKVRKGAHDEVLDARWEADAALREMLGIEPLDKAEALILSRAAERKKPAA